ncbi:MAG: hypothetical protein HOY79_17570 [Streptomyces sp.]|nr:hypothetical protein [Streptomyces sp.]
MDTQPETPTRDRWRSLTPEQRELAEDLMRRAEKLRDDADGELSIAEAVAVAAAQLGYPLHTITEAGKGDANRRQSYLPTNDL